MKIQNISGVLAVILILSGVLIKEFGLIYNLYDPAENILEIESNLENQLQLTEIQVKPIIEQIESDPEVSFPDINFTTDFPFYIYKSSRLFYWSDFRFVPDYNLIYETEEIKYITTGNGSYVVRKWKLNNDNDFEIFSLIPIYYEPDINNEYLQSSNNPDIFKYSEIKPLPQRLEGREVIVRDNFLFSIESNVEYSVFNTTNQIIAFTTFLLGIMLSLYFTISFTNRLRSERKFEWAFLNLLASFVLIRMAMLYSEFPNGYGEFLIFDSKLFASSYINPSIGDLFLNTLSLLAVVIFLFRNYHKSSLFVRLLRLNSLEKIAISTILITAGFMSLYYHYFLFRTIYNNSQWSLDIMHSIEFNLPKIIFYLIFILNSIIFFLTYHILFRVISKLTHRSFFYTLLSYSMGGLLLIILAYQLEIPLVFFIVLNLAYYFLLYLLRLPRFLIQLRYFAFLYLFVSAIASAIIGAYSIYTFEERNTFNNKVRFADQFLVENDNLAELLLSEAVFNIKEDPLITSRIYSPFLSKETVAQKIKRFYLGHYFDKFNIEVYIYNAKGEPFESESTIADFNQIKSTFALEQYETDYPDLYFVNRVGVDVTKRYFYFIDIERYGNIIGKIIVDLSLKKIIPETVYPELLVDSRFFVPYENTNYSYAVIVKDQITYSSGEFNFHTSFNNSMLDETNLFETGLVSNGHQHFAVIDKDNRIIVISNPTYSIFKFISNFSFLFLILVMVIISIIGINAAYNSFSNINLKYATKIQLYLNMAFILPLFVVSIATLSLINQSFKGELEKEHYQKAQNLARDIMGEIESYNALNIDREQLANNFSQVSKNANTDANLFNIRGRLIATSQPAIYENNLLSEYINPKAILEIREKGNNRVILQESVGKLKYNSSYIAVKSSETGNIIALLSIPFFDSEYILERQQIDVLANIMNIFTAIFLILL